MTMENKLKKAVNNHAFLVFSILSCMGFEIKRQVRNVYELVLFSSSS
jgi:hypothetical protein